MRKINLPLVLDTLFAAVCAFLLFFTAMRYYTHNVIVALAFGGVAFILFGALSFIYISKKQNKKLLISRDEKQKKLLALHLSLSSDDDIISTLKKVLIEENQSVKAQKGKITVCDKIYFYNFKMQPINEDDVAKIIKVKSDKSKILLCNSIGAEGKNLCDNFSIKTEQIDFLYSLLKQKDSLPEKYIYEGAKKQNILSIIKSRFSRRISAPLFWSGFALLALSYFTFFPIYYIISGGIMLILSAVALVIN